MGKSSHQRSQIIPEGEVTGPMDDCASRRISRENCSISAARTALRSDMSSLEPLRMASGWEELSQCDSHIYEQQPCPVVPKTLTCTRQPRCS